MSSFQKRGKCKQEIRYAVKCAENALKLSIEVSLFVRKYDIDFQIFPPRDISRRTH